MHLRFQSVLALVALAPLAIGSPLLRRELPLAVISDLSAIDTAANAATDAANALPDTVTIPDQLKVSRYHTSSHCNNIFSKGRRATLLRFE
jgi:hypothetical protein